MFSIFGISGLTSVSVGSIFCYAMLNTQKKTKETQVGVRMDTETRKRLETAAARESRTISDMARLLISEGLKRRKVA